MKTEKEIQKEIDHMNNLLKSNEVSLDMDFRGILLAYKGSLEWVLDKSDKSYDWLRRNKEEETKK